MRNNNLRNNKRGATHYSFNYQSDDITRRNKNKRTNTRTGDKNNNKNNKSVNGYISYSDNY